MACRPAESAHTGGEVDGESGLGHEGVAGNQFEGKRGRETHRHAPLTVAHLRQRCLPMLGRWSGRRC
jgi:hypothetical protein